MKPWNWTRKLVGPVATPGAVSAPPPELLGARRVRAASPSGSRVECSVERRSSECPWARAAAIATSIVCGTRAGARPLATIKVASATPAKACNSRVHEDFITREV